MSERIERLISEGEINERIEQVAAQISRDYAGQSLHLICILKGAAMFMCDLAKRIRNDNVTMDFMSVSSYGAGTVTSGIVRIVKDLDEPLEGKNVLIVEDIVDTGHTLSHLRRILLERQPKSIEICTLLNKPSRREKEVPVKYSCFEIPDRFVVGYGLDYDQRYRNLPYIGVVNFD
ncbi:hypoxanthine phosphoribosyltransferase [Oribacterium sp. oral taxon 102]|uniref:hypoxanthine phosphoribosyltransferase n=1 Tax=Oribacterium sp. oral taxon 102 TaxID=671214 RepID=UPI0015BA0EBD|nr:hypoxanthine phosphoribosyltransferase [Oribacterium sp. oral taxon 102]NWO21106.1 hypoxanthine phosphoribosyltransferase [Oribacterium sp. oral taxon 102]